MLGHLTAPHALKAAFSICVHPISVQMGEHTGGEQWTHFTPLSALQQH